MSNFGNLLFSVGAEGSGRGPPVFREMMGRRVGGAGRKQFFSASAAPFRSRPFTPQRPHSRCDPSVSCAQSGPGRVHRGPLRPFTSRAPSGAYPFMHRYCIKLQYVNNSFSMGSFCNYLIFRRRVFDVKSCQFLATPYKKCGKTTFCCHFATFPYMKNFTFGGVLVADCYFYRKAPYLSFIEPNIDFPVSLPYAM